MGRCGHYTFYVFDDLHIYRSKEQLPQRKHPHPEVRQVYLFTHTMHILMLLQLLGPPLRLLLCTPDRG